MEKTGPSLKLFNEQIIFGQL